MGPIKGYVVLELAGIGPAPMAGMLLADMGATVIRIERPSGSTATITEPVSSRGKKSLVLNLKSELGLQTLLSLIERADVLIDPYRPGVCEKLGIGPEVCLARNPRLIFARMTGWGQAGPLAQAAGHDINFIAITGALHATGRKGEKPVAPLNLVGDMGGGGMLLANGVLAALLERERSGKGQVVDAAMVDGAAQLMWMFHGFAAQDGWDATQRESNILDGGAHFYDTYECADGKYIAIGAVETQFYRLLIESIGLDDSAHGDRNDPANWPAMKQVFTELFLTKSQQQWCEILEGSDACFAPVLNFIEAPKHPANVERNTYINVDGIVQPAPAPRFSRTPSTVAHGAHPIGEDSIEILNQFGFSEQQIAELNEAGILG